MTPLITFVMHLFTSLINNAKLFMTSTTSNTIGKVAALVAGFTLVAMSFAVAPAAHAQTTMTAAQIQAEITALQAQLSAAQGGSMTTPMFTTSLTIGSTGSEVSALQTWLIGKGYSIPAGATGYFGTQTQAAVAAYQAANGISPAVGYFGPITMAKVNASAGVSTGGTTAVSGCAPGAMYSSTTGQACSTTATTGGSTTTPLSGGEGSINNFQTIGATNVTLGTGASQQVYGFQFQAGGSDLEVNRIYYAVSNPTLDGTTRPWNVFQTATLTNGSGATVATVDATNQANWSEDGTLSNGNQVYRLDFENVNNVVKEGATQDYYLTLSTDGAFAAGNVISGTQFTVGLDSQGLRATDALGLQQYSPSSAGSSTVNLNNNSTGSITLSTGSDNPQTQTIMANQYNATQNVVVTTFTLDNTGTSAVELYTLPVTLHTASTTAGVDNLAQSSSLVQDLKIYQGTTLLDTESPSSTFVTGGTLSFKNLNVSIPAGTTDAFSVQADIQPVGGSNPAPSGAAVQVNIPGTGADIETTSGSIITPSGSTTGNAIGFAINGLTVDAAPAASTWQVTTSGSGTQQTGTYNFTFNVTAFGQDIYVSSTTNGFTPLQVVDQTGAATTTQAATISSGANRSTLGNYVIHSGQTESFTIGFTKQGQNGVVQAKLSTLKYGTADATPTSATYTLPSTYQSTQQFLSD